MDSCVVVPMLWDVVLLALRGDRGFRFGLACLCKNLPSDILIYLAREKWLHQMTRPILAAEVPSHNFGYATIKTTTSSNITWKTRSWIYVSEAYAYNLDADDEGWHSYVYGTPSREWSIPAIVNKFIYWHLDVVTLTQAVLERMHRSGKVNVQTAKEIAANTLNYLLDGDEEIPHKERFLRAYLIANIGAKRQRAGLLESHECLSPLAEANQSEMIDEMREELQDYTPDVVDTIPYFPCNALITQLP